MLRAFLLNDQTTLPNNGISDHHYIAVMELLAEEIKARKHLEVAVTQLYNEVVMKTSNISGSREQTKMIADLTNKLQDMDNKTNMLEKSVKELKSENTVLQNSLSVIEQKYTVLQQNYSMLHLDKEDMVQKQIARDNKFSLIMTEIGALKQLKSVNQLQDVHTLKTDTETLKRQVHSLTSNQAARGQDFLALYNQTLAFRSDLAQDISKLSRQHNTSISLIEQNIRYENKTSSELISNMNKTVHDFNQDITNKVNENNGKIQHTLNDEIHLIRQQVKTESNGNTGGGFAGDTGAAPEAVCLPLDPDFSKISGAAYARMHGAEFKSNFFSSNSAGQDLPCAVCRVKKASSIIMIPGKNRCYTGWNMEYHGYLSSGRYDHSASSSYICVDINPEYVTGGSSNKNDGKHFYEVFAICGSLNCPPYHNDYPMTCVVCSK
ncbi:Hypothetical predicted protein [Mytilus galloprovincialis]|uniref:Uncharacterized protein n=2 Tax=Mytilus galloprovincialis TaxID=29158 RepID=A0A8B6BLQ1_MYTGA|nr:Hypothetical predicted protein [Mytilus galloprovincialis]